MKKQTDLFTFLQIKLYSAVIYLLFSYCLINALYSFIIGGKSIYLWSILILIAQTVVVFKSIFNQKTYSFISWLALSLSLFYLHGFSLIFQAESAVLLCSSLLVALCFNFTSTSILSLKVLFMLSLFLLCYAQYQELNTLKDYYESVKQDETWQQFGAL